MKQVHKYPVPLDDQWHKLPVTGRVVHVGVQNIGACVIWVESGGEPRNVAYRVYGTGQDIGNHPQHVGTVQAGMFVWHVYEYNYDTAK